MSEMLKSLSKEAGAEQPFLTRNWLYQVFWFYWEFSGE